MKSVLSLVAMVALLCSAPLRAQIQPAQLPRVACIGHSPYVYRVTPGTQSVSSLEVGVEDNDLSHYTLLGAPANWVMSIVTVARPHDIGPTAHGSTSSAVGTCPFVLKFSKGPGLLQSLPFDLSYSYQPFHGDHDVNWKVSGGLQSFWNSAVGTHSGPVHSPTPLNTLLIVLDDTGTDHLADFDDPTHTHPRAFTPELEALADQGIRFRNFYVNPLCSTSRALFLTGRYSFRNGMGQLSDHSSPFGLDDCEVTIPELLKTGAPSPFTCGAFGKWHLARMDTPTSWVSDPVSLGFDLFAGTFGNSGNHYNWTKIEQTPGSLNYFPVTNQWTGEAVRTDATSWINSAAKPFFAYVCFNPPHHPFNQAPPTWTSDPTPRRLLDEETEAALIATPGDTPLIYRAMIEAVDSEIEYLLDDIGERRENTMIFVVCDNGTPPGMIQSEHPLGHGKATVYQLGVRVPMIVQGPLTTTPGDCEALTGGVDLWRTIGAVAGASDVTNSCSDTSIDSASFLPCIQNPASPGSRTVAFSQLFLPNGPHDGSTFDCLTMHQRAITDGDYKLIRRLDPIGPVCPQCSGQDRPCSYVEEFYRISFDPDEGFDFFEQHAWTPGANAAYGFLSGEMNALSEF